jgi:hypothetical protein
MMAAESDVPGTGRRAKILKSKKSYIAMAFLGLFAFYLYPGLLHVAYDWQREKRSTLRIPPDLKVQIIAGAPTAVQWLEEKIEAGRGSIPALLLLQSLTGETFGQVPNLCRSYGFCGNTSKRSRYCWMNQGFRRMRAQEREAFAEYRHRKSTLRFDRLQNIDLRSAESACASFKQGWDELDGGRIYILLCRESQGPQFFWRAMRYIEWLREKDGLSYRITSVRLAPGPQDYIEIYSETDPDNGPKGHGVFYSVFRNEQTQQYEILL